MSWLSSSLIHERQRDEKRSDQFTSLPSRGSACQHNVVMTGIVKLLTGKLYCVFVKMQILTLKIWNEARDPAFLISSHVVQIRLVLGSHRELQVCRRVH